MEEVLVGFQVAKTAKEKGFPVKDGEPAPTQATLQKWLREQHLIHIEVSVNILREWYFTGYDLGEKRCAEIPEMFEAGDRVQCSTYEEALEKALQTALNLI